MQATRAIPDLLWAFLQERRRHRRHHLDTEGRLLGPRGQVPVRVLDISRGGVRLVLCRQHLLLDGPEDVLLDRNFGPSVGVAVPGIDLSTEAQVVRFAWLPGDDEHAALGCRFLSPLSEESWARFGFDDDGDGAATAGEDPSVGLLFRESGCTALAAQIHELCAGRRVPLFEGHLVRAQENILGLLTADGDPQALWECLADRELGLVVLSGVDAFWAVKVVLQAVGAGEDGGIELTVRADLAPPPHLIESLGG